MGAQRVLALTNRRAYADLTQGQGTQIDIAITPAQTVIGELLAHVRRSDVALPPRAAAARRLRAGGADLADFQTWVCTFARALGRLESLSQLVPFTPQFWTG